MLSSHGLLLVLALQQRRNLGNIRNYSQSPILPARVGILVQRKAHPRVEDGCHKKRLAYGDYTSITD